MRLLRHSILIRGDGCQRSCGIYCGYQGKVVLEFEEMIWCSGERAVERILECGVKRAEGELIDNVGEVECYTSTKKPSSSNATKTSLGKNRKGRKERLTIMI
jgi:hypothetical protein